MTELDAQAKTEALVPLMPPVARAVVSAWRAACGGHTLVEDAASYLWWATRVLPNGTVMGRYARVGSDRAYDWKIDARGRVHRGVLGLRSIAANLPISPTPTRESA